MILENVLPEKTLEAICVLGRGIEKVMTNRGYVWRPTRYIEHPSENGAHSGTRIPIGLDDRGAIIAGSNANLIAACQILKEYPASDAPRLVIFAAGRPAYLRRQPNPDLTEGQILAGSFRRKVGIRCDLEIVIFARNRDTQDDMDEMLSLLGSRAIRRAAVITVNVHLRRAMEFAKRALEPDKSVQIAFLSSESLLRRRYSRRGGVLRVLDDLTKSEAYRRTIEREQRGLLALKSGTYRRRELPFD